MNSSESQETFDDKYITLLVAEAFWCQYLKYTLIVYLNLHNSAVENLSKLLIIKKKLPSEFNTKQSN